MKTAISIITPVFNGVKFIDSCINNVIEQAYPDAEHIIVDGLSTDGSVEIIRHYANKYPHIRWLSEKDKGQSDAMNKGVLMAHGTILGFLNVDDFYQKNILTRIGEVFKTLKTPSLLVGNCIVWGDDNTIIEINKPSRLKITDLMMGWTINPYPINSSQYFYHKMLHKNIGMYNINENYILDIDFISRAVQAAFVTYINEIIGNYRKIRGTKTVTDIQNGLCASRFMETIEKFREQLTLRQRIQVSIRRNYHKFIG